MKKIILFIGALVSFSIFSQTKVITYEFKYDGLIENEDPEDRIFERKTKLDGEKLDGFTFEVYFDKDLSYYPVSDAFDDGAIFDYNDVSMRAGLEFETYGNSKEKSIYISEDFLGKRLVWEKREPDFMNWKISKETKIIGTYTVYKAEGKSEEASFTVWFAPEIPYSYGPVSIFGLPGLILEAHVNDRESLYSYYCKSIKNDPKNRTLKMPERPVMSFQEVNDYYRNEGPFSEMIKKAIEKEKKEQKSSK